MISTLETRPHKGRGTTRKETRRRLKPDLISTANIMSITNSEKNELTSKVDQPPPYYCRIGKAGFNNSAKWAMSSPRKSPIFYQELGLLSFR